MCGFCKEVLRNEAFSAARGSFHAALPALCRAANNLFLQDFWPALPPYGMSGSGGMPFSRGAPRTFTETVCKASGPEFKTRQSARRSFEAAIRLRDGGLPPLVAGFDELNAVALADERAGEVE